jgi:hypothetical protein
MSWASSAGRLVEGIDPAQPDGRDAIARATLAGEPDRVQRRDLVARADRPGVDAVVSVLVVGDARFS